MKAEILRDYLPLADTLDERQIGGASSQIPGLAGILYEVNDDGFGNPVLKKIDSNTVVIGGAIAALERLCNTTASWKPKTLNELYNINADKKGNDMRSYISLFGVGVGGSGLQFGSVVEKDIKRQDIPDLIPMRSGEALTGSDSKMYHFAKDKGDGTYDWYLKEFSDPIIIKSCWKDVADDDETDGTEILDDISESKRKENIQTFAEFVLDFNTKDVREYYESIGALDQARYNSIGLFTAEKIMNDDGSYDYINIRLFSYLNIDNKSVRIKTASKYIYRILSLV